MNNKIQIYTDKVAKIVAKFPEITRAVVIGDAVNDNEIINCAKSNIFNDWVTIYFKKELEISKYKLVDIYILHRI